MIILDYQKKFHNKIIRACVKALALGKTVAYPTDTCYGLAVDAKNTAAVKRLYNMKGRHFHNPIHVVVPTLRYAKKIGKWNGPALKLAKKYWPGALTLVLELRIKDQGLKMLSANTASVGLRMPKNQIALDLAKHLKRPITATSANLSGKPVSYSSADILKQFKNQKYKPDIIINAGKLPFSKPSTVVLIKNRQIKILRDGPISQKQIFRVLEK